ncbi:unnamed protein product [Arctia plantaginis]|uniref:Uncharacterized protein n=1 Tax=Arctia plantaginis TaxID=874455 RepID=A0A8S0YPW5_ARCPL|nr:unnamed protein product [Arctia plantaginis]
MSAHNITRPFPLGESGDKFHMVMYFLTKCPEVFAMLNQEAVTVAKKLVGEFYSDHNWNFESQVFQEVYKILG